MSNYTLAVAWSGKDALSDSDAAKVISGADFNTEFSAVQTAVNTKADINGAASETFSATTAASGTNTTQVATTQFVTSAITASAAPSAYPVGAIFTTTTAYANSAAVVAVAGGSSWVAFAAGRMLIGVNGTYTAGSTGGEATTTLTTAQLPAHSHVVPHWHGANYSDSGVDWSSASGTTTDKSGGQGISTNANANSVSTGSGTAHNNMPPYIAVYMWKRTA